MMCSALSRIEFRQTRDIPRECILALYQAVGWSCAKKPDALCSGLRNSDSLVSAWDGDTLVGLGNAISDGALVVYYPHLLVLPEYQRRGIGKRILQILTGMYADFHQQILLAEGPVAFYEKCGFVRAETTVPMWIMPLDAG